MLLQRWLFAFAFVCLPGVACAQSSEFEVASIKPNTSGEGRVMIGVQPGGRFNAENMATRALIRFAYNVKDFQISGGPAWMNSDRYDVTAKGDAAAGFEPMRTMVQSLLADRFKLMLHRETKELPVYDLVAAKGGLKLAAPKEGSCTTPDRNNPPRPPQPGEPPPRYCGNIRMGRGLVEAYGINMERFLTVLSDTLGRTVIDKTGFTGTFDVHLEFAPDEAVVGGPPGQPASSADSNAPSIFTALQEQLGLKVDSSKGPVEVLVIDHAEKPSEN
jgi:uncharacterized protein (TIGR03435 family)